MNMNEIVCPHCQKAFKVDESGYAEILKQVHDKDFDKQLAERISALKDVNTIAIEQLNCLRRILNNWCQINILF